MRCRLFASLIALGALAGCDDDEPLVCDTPQPAALPTTGDLESPDELPPLDCVEGGLGALPGRWFVRDPERSFTFSYPRYVGSCGEGFRNAVAPADDLDPGDGRTRQTWSDGTRQFVRTWRRFEFMGEVVFEQTSATVTCVTADGNLGYAWGVVDSDRGPSSGSGLGTKFGPRDEPAALGLERVGGLIADGNDDPIVGLNVVVDGTTAYVVGYLGLHVIDVSDPAAPRPLATVPGRAGDGFNDVRVVRGAGGRLIAFASPLNDDETSVIDVTDPRAPVKLANIEEFSHSVQVRVDGERTLLYLATYTSAVPVYDVTDPAQPRRLGAPALPGPEHGIHDLTADGDMIYANNTTGGLVAIDVSAGLDAPVERGRIPTSYSHASWAATINGRKILIHGDEGLAPDDDGAGAFMRILDGDPASPTFLGELARWRSRREVGIHNMEIHGTKAYVAYYQDGVRVVELADPTQPREVAHYNTWDAATAAGGAFEGAVGARLEDGLIYVADIGQGLVILRETP
jgi:hypothetical protein